MSNNTEDRGNEPTEQVPARTSPLPSRPARSKKVVLWLLAIAVALALTGGAVYSYRLYHRITSWGVSTTHEQHELTIGMVISKLQGTSQLEASFGRINDNEAVVEHDRICISLPVVGKHCWWRWFSRGERTLHIIFQAQGLVDLRGHAPQLVHQGAQPVIIFELPRPTFQAVTQSMTPGDSHVQIFANDMPNWASQAWTKGHTKAEQRLNDPANGYVKKTEVFAAQALFKLLKPLGARVVVVFPEATYTSGPTG